MDCLYLRFTNNDQGGHELFHLATNKMITRSRVVKAAITPAIITHVHKIAEQEDMPTGLKITLKIATQQLWYLDPVN